MSKSKQKNHSEIELLRGRVRELESLCRRLKRENKTLKTRTHIYENVIEDGTDNIREPKEKCIECGKGELKIFDFRHLTIKTCETCGYQIKRRRKP